MSSHSNGDPGTTLPTTTPNDASSSLSISAQIQIHRGAIDQTMITTQPPLRVMQHIHSMLLALGVGVQTESTFRLRCIRPIRKLTDNDDDNEEGMKNTDTDNVQDLEDTTGSAPKTTNLAAKAKEEEGEAEEDPKTPTQAHPQLPLPSSSSSPSSAPNPPPGPTTSKPPSRSGCSLYGPTTSDDPAGEVRFSIELTKLAGLSDTYSLDIRRLKGHLRSYKYIYDTLRDRAELNR